jgi:2-amino-4-hydroxy-6-hydroxymethyldihydropteridine diphosphokinase
MPPQPKNVGLIKRQPSLRFKHIAYIGLGANLGDRRLTVQTAIAALGQLPSTMLSRQSSLYVTAPVEAQGDDYVNAVVELHTQLTPLELFNALQQLEQQFGRIRSYRNAPRTLDCDLLLYDQQIIHTSTLQVPHPRMHLRAFVLIPLLEIAPNIHIPGLGAASQMPGIRHQASGIRKVKSKLIPDSD